MTATTDDLFRSFLNTVLHAVDSASNDLALRMDVRSRMTPFQSAMGNRDAIRDYFQHPPSHVVAVNTLDHTRFTGSENMPRRWGAILWPRPLPLMQGSFPLPDIMAICSKLGPVHYGEVARCSTASMNTGERGWL